MAELENKIFGSLKGSLGDVVFRSRNEKNYISRKPKSYSRPDDPGFKERTGKFKLAVKLASAIYSFSPLKKIYNAASADGKSGFTQLMQTNYPFVGMDDVSNMIKMSPPSSFGVNLNNLSMDNNSLSVELSQFSDASNINSSVEKQIQLLAVVFLKQPVQAGLPEYDFLKVTSAKVNIDFVDPVTFNVPLLTAESGMAANYTNKKVIFTAVTYDDSNSVIQISTTVNQTV